MKTVQEIYNSLVACSKSGTNGCDKCAYAPDQCEEMHKDATKLIRQLKNKITESEGKVIE